MVSQALVAVVLVFSSAQGTQQMNIQVPRAFVEQHKLCGASTHGVATPPGQGRIPGSVTVYCR